MLTTQEKIYVTKNQDVYKFYVKTVTKYNIW